MTISISKGAAPENIHDLVVEAVEQLGYFREDAIDALTQLYRDLWQQGTSAHMLNKGDFKPLLSTKGLEAPGPASMNTTLRITGNAQRQRQLANRHVWGAHCSWVEFFCVPKNSCSAALKLKGKKRRPSAMPVIPLEGCDREWCTCGWDPVVR